MEESARIARGKVQPLSALDAKTFDAVLFPGGFGAAKNLYVFFNCFIQSNIYINVTFKFLPLPLFMLIPLIFTPNLPIFCNTTTPSMPPPIYFIFSYADPVAMYLNSFSAGLCFL